jgi:hypothetical protein
VISLARAIRIYINKKKTKFCLNFELAAPYAKNITETRFRRFPDAKISF